jgi:23S rRNA (uridine2552-2'-O)-methyltransferase
MTRRWMSERKKDHYYRLAKQKGYRSRAAYKLIQINRKFNVIKKGYVVVDLGAAPGGWSQVAKEIVGEMGKVLAVDLLKVKPIDGVDFYRGDIKDKEFIEDLLASIDKKVDIVISDMLPKTTGNRSMDHARSIELCEHAFNFAEHVLRPKGNFVVKAFEGDLFNSYFNKIKENFRFCKAHGPKASIKGTKEIYVIAKHFKR